MKPVDENELRKAAKLASKLITDLGSPWGPEEAFVVGAKHAEKIYREYILELEAEVVDLKRNKGKSA